MEQKYVIRNKGPYGSFIEDDMEQKYVIRNKGPYGSFILGKKGFANCLTRDELILFTKEQAIAVCEALTCEGNDAPIRDPIEKYVYSEYFS